MMRASLSTSSVLPSIVVERMNHLSLVMLNRPQKLNALDSEMVSLLTKALRDDLLSKEGCFAFLMFGGGNKAFCAGGDVASVRASGLENPASGEWNSFFREEYRLDALLGSLGSPSSRVKQISFWEGIVMGGGVGLSAHGRFRVTTETTKLAMPETSIGLFPDVGATRLLSRMPRATGIYAALTGARLDAADLMYSGLATHYVPTEKVDAAFAAVAKIDLSRMAPEEADARVDSALKRHSTSVPTKPSSLEINGDVIERCFSHESVEAIAEALRSGTTQFEIDTAKALDAVSPTSLKITLECLKRAKSSSLDEVLKTDFRVACRCCDPAKKSDFYEGVRAVLVDKDRNPSWNPASLQEVSDEDIQRYFDPLDTPLSELDLDDIYVQTAAVGLVERLRAIATTDIGRTKLSFQSPPLPHSVLQCAYLHYFSLQQQKRQKFSLNYTVSVPQQRQSKIMTNPTMRTLFAAVWFGAALVDGCPLEAISTTAGGAVSVWVADVTGDGILDVLAGAESDSTITIYERDGDEFSMRTVDSSAEDVQAVSAADIDGDGLMNVLSASSSDGTFAWFEYEAETGTFIKKVIFDRATGARSIFAIDVDSDSDMDIVGCSTGDDSVRWFENGDGSGSDWIVHEVGTVKRPRMVWAGDVDGDGDVDVLTASKGDGSIELFVNDGSQQFSRAVIDDDVPDARAVYGADVDGDGDIDILGVSADDSTVSLYTNDDSTAAFTTKSIVTDVAKDGTFVFPYDTDDDGIPEIFVAWADSVSMHTRRDDASYEETTVVSDVVFGAMSVHVADFRGDGSFATFIASSDNDMISMVECGRPTQSPTTTSPTTSPIGYVPTASPQTNGSSPGYVPTMPPQASGSSSSLGEDTCSENDIVLTLDTPSALLVFDVDGDQDLDLIAASREGDSIVWFRDGNQTIVDDSFGRPVWLALADVNGDGLQDIIGVSSSDAEVAWYERRQAENVFVKHIVTSDAGGAHGAFAIDVDADGDVDVLTAATGDDAITLFLNNGGDGLDFEAVVLDNDAQGARSVFAIDLDGDGDIDVLSASKNDRSIAWYENVGVQGESLAFTKTVIDQNVSNVRVVIAADLDNDGDADVISASPRDKFVVVYENIDATFTTKHYIDTNAPGATDVRALDVDGDGNMEIFSAMFDANVVAMHVTTGGLGDYETFVLDDQAIGVRTIFPVIDDGFEVFSAFELGDKVGVARCLQPSAAPTTSPPTLTPSPTTLYDPTAAPQPAPTQQKSPPSSSNVTTLTPTVFDLISASPTGTICTTARAGAVNFCHESRDGLCVQNVHECLVLDGYVNESAPNIGCNHRYDSGCFCCRGVFPHGGGSKKKKKSNDDDDAAVIWIPILVLSLALCCCLGAFFVFFSKHHRRRRRETKWEISEDQVLVHQQNPVLVEEERIWNTEALHLDSVELVHSQNSNY